MRPFLLLSIRAEPAAAADEHAAFARFLGVARDDVRRVEVGLEPLEPVIATLDDYSGTLLGGGAFTYSDAPATKSARQLRGEAELFALLDVVVERDLPFLGACYGIGTLGSHQGGVVDRTYPEPVGPLSVEVTEAGASDPLLAGLPTTFAAYGGHKEALSVVPDHAVVLASSTACPVQAFRVGQHVYATQFHPELDLAGLSTRIDTYASFGYFDPAEAETLRAAAAAVQVTQPGRILAAFSARYRRG